MKTALNIIKTLGIGRYHILTIWLPLILKKFGTQVIDEMKKLEKTWMTEQDTTNQEVTKLMTSDPKAAQEKADKDSMNRAEKTFKRLKDIESKLEKDSPRSRDKKVKNK
ncbi:dipeptidase [Streptococcus pseudoporcinus]|nr:dipeptidase [Streptococcus pseudoporcinus]